MLPTLTTEHLILRPLHESDDALLFELRGNPVMSEYINRKVYESIEEVRTWRERIMVSINGETVYYWAITLKDKDALIGTALVFNISQENQRAEIGYEMLPPFQGKGLTAEAVKAVADFCFNTLNLHSLEAVVVPENVASIKLLERNGFVREGLFKEKEFCKGKFCDLAYYSKLNPQH
ncbi:MAG: GNAT family protein [Chitinophagales bacterium]